MNEDLIVKGFRAYMGWDENHEVSDDVLSTPVGQGVIRILDVLVNEVNPECLTHDEAFVLRDVLMGGKQALPDRVKSKLEVISRNGGPGDCDLDQAAATALIAALNDENVDTGELNRAMDLLDDTADLAAASEREKELRRKLDTAYNELDRLDDLIDKLNMPVDEQVAFGVSSYQELAEINLRQAEHISDRLDEAGKLVAGLNTQVNQVVDALGWKEEFPAQEKLEPVPEELPPPGEKTTTP